MSAFKSAFSVLSASTAAAATVVVNATERHLKWHTPAGGPNQVVVRAAATCPHAIATDTATFDISLQCTVADRVRTVYFVLALNQYIPGRWCWHFSVAFECRM